MADFFKVKCHCRYRQKWANINNNNINCHRQSEELNKALIEWLFDIYIDSFNKTKLVTTRLLLQINYPN